MATGITVKTAILIRELKSIYATTLQDTQELAQDYSNVDSDINQGAPYNVIAGDFLIATGQLLTTATTLLSDSAGIPSELAKIVGAPAALIKAADAFVSDIKAEVKTANILGNALKAFGGTINGNYAAIVAKAIDERFSSYADLIYNSLTSDSKIGPLPKPPSPPSGFDGDQVTLDLYAPNITPSDLVASGTTIVPLAESSNPSETFNLTSLKPGPNAGYGFTIPGSLTLSGSTMTFAYATSAEGDTFAPGTFNGYVLTDDNPTFGDILGATLTSTNIAGLTASDITHTSDSVLVNVAGLKLPTNAIPVINIGVHFAVVSPSTDVTNLLAHL